MNNVDTAHAKLASHCRHCRFYTPLGRRGGQCSRLGVTVAGQWEACTVSMQPFAPSWEPDFICHEANQGGDAVPSVVRQPVRQRVADPQWVRTPGSRMRGSGGLASEARAFGSTANRSISS